MRKINVLAPKFRVKEILDEIKICLDKGWSGMGFKTVEFEDAWKNYTGFKHAHFLQSNTVGLHLALNVFKTQEGWKDGDEIISTPLTFVSTNHAILYERLTPVFADVDNFLCLDPKSVEEKITEKTRAVMYVGIGGNAGRLDKIREVCDKHNLKLILDAAHLAGSYTNKMLSDGKEEMCHIGWEADASIFSFQAVKNLPTADSGMICFKNKDYDTIARQLSWLGIDKDTYSRSSDSGSYKWRYDVPNVGFKYHGNSIMASIGLIQLKYLDDDNNYRNKIANWYENLIIDSGLNNILEIVKTSSYTKKSSRHLFQVLVDEKIRDEIISELYDNEIYPGVHYIDNTLYPMYSKSNGLCPNAHGFSKRLITLPINLKITYKDCERIILTLSKLFLNRGHSYTLKTKSVIT